eukprot:PhF_6_TR1484/c0_g1_i2/m.2678
MIAPTTSTILLGVDVQKELALNPPLTTPQYEWLIQLESFAATNKISALRKRMLQLTGTQKDIAKSQSQNLLHIASQHGHSAVAVLLISEFGFPLHVELGKSGRAIHMAAQHGHATIVDYLLSFDGSESGITKCVSQTGMYASHLAAMNGHLDVLKLLVEAGDPLDVLDKDRRAPLHYAVMNGHKHVVEWLLYSRRTSHPLNTSISFSTSRAIATATNTPHLNTPDCTQLPPLYHALRAVQLDIAWLLAGAGAQFDNPSCYWDALQYVCSLDHLDDATSLEIGKTMLEKFQQQKLDPTRKGASQVTAYHIALKHNKPLLAQHLLPLSNLTEGTHLPPKPTL